MPKKKKPKAGGGKAGGEDPSASVANAASKSTGGKRGKKEIAKSTGKTEATNNSKKSGTKNSGKNNKKGAAVAAAATSNNSKGKGKGKGGGKTQEQGTGKDGNKGKGAGKGKDGDKGKGAGKGKDGDKGKGKSQDKTRGKGKVKGSQEQHSTKPDGSSRGKGKGKDSKKGEGKTKGGKMPEGAGKKQRQLSKKALKAQMLAQREAERERMMNPPSTDEEVEQDEEAYGTSVGIHSTPLTSRLLPSFSHTYPRPSIFSRSLIRSRRMLFPSRQLITVPDRTLNQRLKGAARRHCARRTKCKPSGRLRGSDDC